MKSLKLATFIFLLPLLTGCLTTYTFDGKRYHSEEDLHEAQQLWNQQFLLEIPEYKKPKYKSAKIYIPPRQDFIDEAVITNFPGSDVEINLGISQEVSFLVMYQALKKRNLFKDLVLIRENISTTDLESYDAAILFNLVSTKVFGWKIITFDKDIANLYIDTSMAPGPEKMMAWIDSIEKNLNASNMLPDTLGENVNSGARQTNLGTLQAQKPRKIEYTCDQLSQSDAYILLKAGHHYLDKDGDGHPCEWDKKYYKKIKNKSKISSSRNCHWVKGYRRKNGTYVRGHKRCK